MTDNLIKIKHTMRSYEFNPAFLGERSFSSYYTLDNDHILGRTRKGNWYSFNVYREEEGAVAWWREISWKPLCKALEHERLEIESSATNSI